MSKALIISIGTGIGEKSTIVNPIVFSIRNHNPDHIFFVVSKTSREQTLPAVRNYINKPFDVWELSDENNVDKCFRELCDCFKKVKMEFDYVVVDYTSGTKPMSSALAIVGSLLEADSLSYVAGERVGGIVASGTEKLITLQHYEITVEKKIGEAIAFFNNYQFDAALSILTQLQQKVASPVLPEWFSELVQLAKAYSAWDRFNHEQARGLLKTLKNSALNKNKEFLGKLQASDKLQASEVKEPYYIADLINNAYRRNTEGKYDDAVARLYRTVEMIAQWRLKRYDILDTGDVPPEKLPLDYPKPPLADGKIKLGLYNCYQLLEKYGDSLGAKFTKDPEFQSLINVRNSSILAHGISPVDKDNYDRLCDKVFKLAAEAFKSEGINLEELCTASQFIKWNSA